MEQKNNVIRENMGRATGRVCEEFSYGYYYYGICTFGGMLSAGTTHLLTTPLDVLKVNMQFVCLGKSTQVYWHVNWIIYSIERTRPFFPLERTFVFFLGSASAQVFADVALCPFEAVKVRVQTQPHFAKGLSDGFPKVYKTEGLAGFYRGLVPLWGRNLPFSVIMFSTFEHSVDLMYQKIIQKRKEDCPRVQQLGVTCLAGYAAGAVGTVISNPADNIVASLYNRKAENVLQAVKKIGFPNLFTRSLPVRIIIVGPVVTLQWFFYDAVKVLNGLPTSGGLRQCVEEANLSA
ncbi:Phosphate carrier, mitochondrial [Melia azedarach]|uniref:Phosphate carrier, mitochondrial n=1 Tax=Melia azedarach TaxID=155640 RepID=A0ACC1XWL2_MELAZ|nr:Phosphate carrier, mitochondrial [Melia azedarach]